MLSGQRAEESFDKSNKRSQYDYAFSRAGFLRSCLKTHGGGKSNKCNQCGFAPSHVSNLKTNVKTHSGKNQIIATNVTFHPHVQAI